MPRAVVLRGYGPPEALALADLPRPRLSVGELRVRTIAAGVNRTDIEIRAGAWPIRKQSPFPYVPGIEVVGQVIELGLAVAPFQNGDHVIAMMMGMGGVRAERAGGYQDEVVLRAADCSILPVDIDPLAVAALGVAGVTALGGFDFVGAGPDRRVMVTGAGGGVGTCAIRIGKALGVEVVAVTRDPLKIGALRALGADDVVVATNAGELPEGMALPQVTGVLDTVGGPLFGRLVEALAPGGKLCFLGGAASDAVEFSAWQLMEGIVLGGWSSETLDGMALRSAVGRLTSLMRHGSLEPPPVTRFPLEEAAAAHRALALSRHVGRVLLTP